MDVEHLRLFKDIAAHGSVSRGAALNDVSQSAASQHLQELEQKLGAVLLDRTKRPLVVTQIGQLYLHMCRDILRRVEEFDTALQRFKATVEGKVRVAAIYSVGLSEMTQLEQRLRQMYPSVTLEKDYLRPEKVYEAVLSGQADLGLVSYPEATKEIAALPWREEQMVVAASPYHPLARKTALAPEDLEGVDFIAFDNDLPIRREIDRFLRGHHVTVNIALHFDNLQMIKEAVALGTGVSIVPARVMENEISQGRLVPIPILAPELFRPLGIIFRRKKQFHRAAEAFLELLQERPGTAATFPGETDAVALESSH